MPAQFDQIDVVAVAEVLSDAFIEGVDAFRNDNAIENHLTHIRRFRVLNPHFVAFNALLGNTELLFANVRERSWEDTVWAMVDQLADLGTGRLEDDIVELEIVISLPSLSKAMADLARFWMMVISSLLARAH